MLGEDRALRSCHGLAWLGLPAQELDVSQHVHVLPNVWPNVVTHGCLSQCQQLVCVGLVGSALQICGCETCTGTAGLCKPGHKRPPMEEKRVCNSHSDNTTIEFFNVTKNRNKLIQCLCTRDNIACRVAVRACAFERLSL